MPSAHVIDRPHAPPPATLYRASLPFARRLEPSRDGSGLVLCNALSDQRVWVSSRLLAWVLLPDAWQGLVQAGALDSTALRLSRVQEAGERAWATLGRPGSPWAAGARLSSVDASCDPREVARELVSGPVRAGITTRLGDYPFWDAIWLDDLRPASGSAPAESAITRG